MRTSPLICLLLPFLAVALGPIITWDSSSTVNLTQYSSLNRAIRSVKLEVHELNAVLPSLLLDGHEPPLLYKRGPIEPG